MATIEVFLALYGIFAVITAAIGIVLWTDYHKECDKIGARVFFLAPFWLPVLVGFAAHFLIKQAGKMWRDTGWSKRG